MQRAATIVPGRGGNFYSYRDYIASDMKTGVLHARGGTRIMAFPECFVTGLLDGLQDECGQAWPIVRYRCGEWWGQRQMKRMEKHLGEHFGSPLKDLVTAQVHATLCEGWATEGWGRFSFDLAHIQKGLLVLAVPEGIVAEVFRTAERPAKGKPVDSLVAGALGGMFSQASGADLVAHEISCSARGDECCKFVVGLRSKLEEVPGWVRKNQSPDEIMAQLTQ
jgi:predicted hydrocarbon binding protein